MGAVVADSLKLREAIVADEKMWVINLWIPDSIHADDAFQSGRF